MMDMQKIWSLVVLMYAFVAGILAQSKVEQSEDGSSGSIKFSTPDLHDDEAHSPWMPDELRCDACKAVTYQLWMKFDAFNQKRKSLKYNLPESDVLDIVDSVCEDTKTWDGYGLKELKPNKDHRLVGEGLKDHKEPGVIIGGGFWPGSYGMKEVNGVHRLSGGGLETADVPGITAGGGKWPMSYGVKQVKKVNRLAGPGLDTAELPGITASGGKWPDRLRDMCEQYSGDLGELVIYNEYKKKPKTKARLEDYLCRGPGIRGDCLESDGKRKDEL